MFCPNCGTNNDAGTLFCENCGTRLASETQYAPQQPVYQQPTYQQPVYQQPPYQPQASQLVPAPKKSKLPVIIIALVVAAAIAVGCYFAFSGSDSGKSGSVPASEVNNSDINAATAFVEGLCYNDPDLAFSAVYPEMDGIESEIEDQCEDIRADAEKNDVTFENIYVSDVQDDSEEISLAEEYMLESYGTEVTIDELQLVTVTVERSSGSDSDSMNVDVYVAKIDGKWYTIRTA